MVIACRGSRLMLAALLASLVPVVGCAKGNESTGTAGTGGATGTGGSGGVPADDPFIGLPAAKALHVQGNKLVDTTGATVRLLGVNRAGSEYMCSPPTVGGTTFDGSTGPSSITALLTWNMNTVRLPLNEHCWLGINGSLISADEYRSSVIDYVVRLHQRNLYVVLDLHWSAPGSTVIMGGSGGNQLVTMAFADHAIEFWTSVATVFKNDPMVIFDLFNEPILNANDRFGNGPMADSSAWACWRNGCAVTKGQVAGMQQMLNAVRATGAQQVVVAGGIEWSHNLDGWLQSKPDDPTGNLMAAFHVYQRPLSDCDTQACWDGALKAVSQNVPVLTGEMGEQDCAHGFIDQYMTWADAQGISYLGWAWNPQACNTFPALITNFDGTPTAFGQGLKDHLATFPALH
jgi:hypothetical protein